MDIQINKFAVRYQGQDYGPGSVIYGLDDMTGIELVESSNGDIVALPSRKDSIQETADTAETTTTGLPPVNPNATVKKK